LKPSYKIEVYDTSDALVHTITSDVITCNVKLRTTTEPSTFSFVLQGQSGRSYFYNDIGLNYKVKIYMGYGTLAAGDLQLVGKILKITNDGDDPRLRVFEGKDLGEQLERQFVTNTHFNDTGTAVVASLASDAGIFDLYKLSAAASTVTLTVRTESYWDVLRKISDYWVDADHKIQRDFYVDNENELVWKSRPIRTVGVETLTVGANITSYKVIYDLFAVKNSITVYGAASAFWPNDKDEETEVDTNWTATSGTLSAEHVVLTPVEGSEAILCQHADTTAPDYEQTVDFELALPTLNIRDINKLNFYYYPGRSAPAMTYTTQQVYIYAPDAANCFYFDLAGAADTWTFFSKELGPEYEYDATEQPTGWHVTGSPNWWNMQAVRFLGEASTVSGTLLFGVDKLWFSPYRWVGSASDATSQTNYGLREAEYTDENLLSNDECDKRAESLLMQFKDRVLAVQCVCVGNTNILRGDRLSLTLPAENISAVNFDVVNVEHSYRNGDFTTTFEAIYDVANRSFPPTTPAEALHNQVKSLKSVTSELYSRVVR